MERSGEEWRRVDRRETREMEKGLYERDKKSGYERVESTVYLVHKAV